MRRFTLKLMSTVCLALLGVCGAVAQTHTWKYVTTGDATTYAIDSDGTLWAWGWNESGQMGIGGGDTKISTPTQVGTNTDWKSAVAGQAYAFFIKENGTLWAVGDNSSGVSGVGDGATNHKVPTQVGSDSDWESVACSRFYGHSVCAIKTDGTLWAWGDGRMGQLGVGSYASKSTPTQVGTDTDWAQVSMGNNFTIALKKDGSLYGWGENSNKTLFTNSKYCKSPVRLGTDNDWVKVFAVVATAYGIKTDGKLYVWGASDNNMAGLNNEDLDKMSQPYEVTAVGGNVIDITGSDYNRHVGVGENGVITKIYSWGQNADGALGDGSGVAADATEDIETIVVPVEVALPTGLKITQMAGGIGYCTVLTDNGKIYGWGKNRGGQLGNYCAEDQMTFCPNVIQCAVQNEVEEKVYTISPSSIPSQLNDAKKLILTGLWTTSDFQALSLAIGNNTGFPPSGNSTIEEIDMSQAQIEDGTSTYVAVGMSNYGVFRGLKALTTVTMPAAEEAAHFKSLRSIFQNCTALEAIDLTGCTNVTNLTDAFFGCAALTSIDLSACDKITSSESMFDQCSSITEVKLPASITLGKYAFGDNQALTKIDWSKYGSAEAPAYPNYLFQYITDLKVIMLIVPDEAYDAFVVDENWSKLNVVKASEATGISSIKAGDAAAKNGVVYTVGGAKVKTGNTNGQLSGLPKGLYIIGGKKVMVK